MHARSKYAKAEALVHLRQQNNKIANYESINIHFVSIFASFLTTDESYIFTMGTIFISPLGMFTIHKSLFVTFTIHTI